MSNPYINSYQQYSPTQGENPLNTSPTFHNLSYVSRGSGGALSSASSTSSQTSNYSLHNPRLRYYLSKSFDAEDDLEFCPDIPESTTNVKKFNPYTALVFSPTTEPQLPRVSTPRIKKPIEIVNLKARTALPQATTK